MLPLSSIIDLSEEVAQQAPETFFLAEPYLHAVIDGLWVDDFLRSVADEIPTIDKWTGEKNFFGSVQKRWLSDWQDFPPITYEFLTVLNSGDFATSCQKLHPKKI